MFIRSERENWDEWILAWKPILLLVKIWVITQLYVFLVQTGHFPRRIPGKCSNYQLVWFTAIFDLYFWKRPRMFTKTFEEVPYCMERNEDTIEVCLYPLFWLSWMQRKNQDRWGEDMFFSGETLYFCTGNHIGGPNTNPKWVWQGCLC